MISILVVEDSKSERDLIAEVFSGPEAHRFRLLEASRLASASEILERESVDLILLDLGLPDSTGIATLDKVLHLKNVPPVVVLTGDEDESVGKRAIRNGAQDYLIKGSGTEIMLPRICIYALERARFQVSVKRSEAFLRSAIDSLSSHIAILDRNGLILLVNESWRRFAQENGGLEQKLCEGVNYFDIKLEESRSDYQNGIWICEQIRQVIDGAIDSMAAEYPCHSGREQRWFSVRATAFRDRTIEGAIVAHENITELKSTEEKLRTSREFLRTIFDTTPNLVFVVDSTGVCVMANQALAQLFEVPVDALVGTRITECPVPEKPVGEAFQRLLSSAAWNSVSSRETITVHELVFTDNRHRRRDYRLIKTSIEVEKGRDNYLVIGIDLTELRLSQQDLKDSELRLHTILDAMHQGIVLHDVDMKVLWANDQAGEMFGLPRLQSDEFSWTDCGFEQSESGDFAPQRALRTKKIESETRAREKTQSIRLTGCPVIDTAGNVTGVVSIVEDISRIESLENQLRQAQKMESLGTLAGGIAHDFNNILTAIMGFSELALGQGDTSDYGREAMEEVYKASVRARDLVHQILTFSRRIDQQLKPLDISLVVKEALKLLRASLPATIEMFSRIEKNTGMVLADPTHIHQIVMNLCTNASHALAGTGGTIEVILESAAVEKQDLLAHPSIVPGKYLRLQVTDTGTGIPDEHLGSIFEPYFTTKEHGEGTGLGLAVVHGIIKEYGGDISVTSRLGVGTTFEILLPEVFEESDADSDRDAAVADIKGRGEQILVVDDEPGITLLCSRVFGAAGYAVQSRNDPREVMEQIECGEIDFDLMVTDMTMPHLTGDILVRALRSRECGMPVIIMSGNVAKLPPDLDEDPQVRLISKPLDRNQLLEVMAGLLQRGDGKSQAQPENNGWEDGR